MSENKTNTNANNNEKREPMYLAVTETQKFEKLASTSLETTQRLAKRINKLFSTAFADYYGAVVSCVAGNGNINAQQMFNVELHFKPIPAGAINPNDSRIRAFAPVDETKKTDDLVSNLRAMYSSLNTSSRYVLTKEAAEILSEFMLPGTNIDPFNPKSFDNLKSEYTDNSRFGANPAMVRIVGVDITKLVKKIYGNKDAYGKKVDYGVIPYGPVTPNLNQNVSTANWRVMIMQVEAEKAFDLAAEFGLIQGGNGSAGPVITATF